MRYIIRQFIQGDFDKDLKSFASPWAGNTFMVRSTARSPYDDAMQELKIYKYAAQGGAISAQKLEETILHVPLMYNSCLNV